MLTGQTKTAGVWKTQGQRYIPGAHGDDIDDYMKSLLWKLADYIILHIDANNALDNTSREILNKILKLKAYKH